MFAPIKNIKIGLDRSELTVRTQIRLLLIRVYMVLFVIPSVSFRRITALENQTVPLLGQLQ